MGWIIGCRYRGEHAFGFGSQETIYDHYYHDLRFSNFDEIDSVGQFEGKFVHIFIYQ